MKFGGIVGRSLQKTLRDRHEPDRIHLLADLYWRVILVTAFIVLVLVFFYSIWGLTSILNDLGAIADTSAAPPPALNRPLLDATVQAFETRKTQFENLKTNRSVDIGDPSL